MTFKNWKIWLRSLPISMKWFVILILLRPIIDLFYFLKEISPLLSPLNIVGILTPIFIIFSFLSSRFPRKYKSIIIDLTYGLWAILVAFNLVILLGSKMDFSAFSNVVRYSTPIFLFYYFRSFIKSKVNLIGLLQTFYYSASIPALMLIYEVVFEPISPEYVSEGRGGGARAQGGYADIMNYAIYIVGVVLYRTYVFLKEARMNKNNIRKGISYAVVLIICIFGLLGIKQTSSWVVVIFLFSLFIFYYLRNLKGFLIILLFSPLLFVVGSNIYNEDIVPLVEKEYRVIEGKSELRSSFNGRMGRWFKYFDIWAEMPVISNVLGTPLSGNNKASIMISGGMHNDYVRVLFLTGIIGLVIYILFFINLINRVRKIPVPERFLIFGAIGIMLIYSISTTPLLYAPLIYIIYPIFAYAALPKIILLKKGNG